MKLILASRSPRRSELLARLGLDFQIEAADIDETMDPAKPVFDEVARTSRKKAEAVQATPNDVVIAADTVVVLDGRTLGKPGDEAGAVRMLHLLSGRSHEVMTGLTVRKGDEFQSATTVTGVHFRRLSEQEIEAYVKTGEPLDKAGAYGIQGLASIFVDRLEGDYYNIMGLPLCPLAAMLRKAGIPILNLI